MAKKSQNSTSAIYRGPIGAKPSLNESVSVSSRKIDNGYVVSTSRSTDDGYTCTETFSTERPQLSTGVDPGVERGAGPSGSMKRAVDFLNK